MRDPLRKNLLLSLWFVEDFEEEYSASFAGNFVFCFLGMGLTREESSASSQGIL